MIGAKLIVLIEVPALVFTQAFEVFYRFTSQVFRELLFAAWESAVTPKR